MRISYRHHDLRPAKLEMRERAGNEVHRCACVVKDLLELGGRLLSVTRLQVGRAAKIRRLQWNFQISSQKAFALLGSWNHAARCR